MALDFYDTFTRVEASGLGVSDSGHTWTVGGTGTQSVDGSDALFGLTADNSSNRATVNGVDEADVDLTCKITLSEPPLGDYTSLMMFSRYSTSSIYMSGGVELNPDGTTTMRVRKDGSSVASASGPSWTGEQIVCVRFRTVGTAFRVKVWFGDDEEPAGWNLSTTATSSVASGSVGLRFLTGASSTVTYPYEIRVREATFVDARPTETFTDTFTRTVSNSFGVADSDHVWAVLAGDTTKLSTNGTRGVFSMTDDGAAVVPSTQVVVGDFHATAQMGVLVAQSTDHYIGFAPRWTDANNYMWFYIKMTAANTATAYVRKTVAGVTTEIANSSLGSFTPGTLFSVRAEIMGSQVRFKVWAVGSAEPGAWTIEETDTALPAAGQFAIRTIRDSGGSGSGVSYIDDLTFRDIAPEIEVELIDEVESPGVRLTITNGDVYPLIRVTRIHVANEFYPGIVRGLNKVVVSGSPVTVDDFEIPLDEEFTYHLETLDANYSVISTADSESIDVPVPYHRTIIRSVGQPSLSRRVQITSFPSYSNNLRVLQEAKVLGRPNPVIIFDVMEGNTGEFECMATLDQSDPSGQSLRTLFKEGQPLLFQNVKRITSQEDFYFVATSVELIRRESIHPSRLPRCVYKVSFIQVDQPDTSGEAASFFTWQTLVDAGHVDWQSVYDTFDSWTDVLNFTSRTP